MSPVRSVTYVSGRSSEAMVDVLASD